jgi:hypothetical protein
MVNSFPPERGSRSRCQQVGSVSALRFHRRSRRFELYRSVSRANAQAHPLRNQQLRQFDIANLQSGLDVEGASGNLVFAAE